MMKLWRMRCLEHVARIREKKNAFNILIGKPRRRWEDNTKIMKCDGKM
jgi:hypothetical protein